MNLIDRDKLKAKLDRGEDVQLVLALGPAAYRAAHIPGSRTFASPEEAARSLGKDDDIVVYCSHERCPASVLAYHTLVRNGYRRVRRYAGGLDDWQQAGYPLEGASVGQTDAEPRPSTDGIDPVLLAVLPDQEVLERLQRDLDARYRAGYRLVGAPSVAAARHLLEQLNRRGEDLALVLVDQRLPGRSGIEFLVRTRSRFPHAKRVLILDQFDSSSQADGDAPAVARAMASGDLHHVQMRPWEPADDYLYPDLDELLADWSAEQHPQAAEIRLVDRRWSARANELRDLLQRNRLPFRWIDHDTPEGQQLLAAAMGQTDRLPVMLLPDGQVLADPTNLEVAEALGAPTRPDAGVYDLVVVGAGPAGLAAAVSGACEGLRTLVIEREAAGGQAGTSARIENYLGFPSGISGSTLAHRAAMQAARFGSSMVIPQAVTGLDPTGPVLRLRLADGGAVEARAVVLATGVSYRRLDAPGVERLIGAGVYYGSAIVEGPRLQGQHVVVCGAGNAAGQAAVHLARFAGRVTVLARSDSLASSMSHYLVERLEATGNIGVRLRTRIVRAHGLEHLEGLTIEDITDGGEEALAAQALFVLIGARPHTDWLERVVARDEHGFVRTGTDLVDGSRWPLERERFPLETSVPGVFAVGDVRRGSVKRVASAVGDGSVVLQGVHEHLCSQQPTRDRPAPPRPGESLSNQRPVGQPQRGARR